MKLNDREWKPFELRTIMQSVNSKSYHSDNLIFDNKNGIPYITRTAKNNGIYGFVKNQDEFYVNSGNTISFGAETASFFYQQHSYITGNKMYYLHNKHLNKYNGMFISVCLHKNIKDCFSYSNGAIPERVMRKSVMLPVTDEGKPDYQFMEDYIKELIEKKKEQYKNYVKNIIKSFNTTINLSAVKWDSFIISDIFDIKPGKRLVAANSTEGERPFIGALDNNNGVARFVSDDNVSKDKNVLGVNYNGNGMVIGFYHPYECIFSDDVKRFHLKHYPDNEYVLLFMKALILKQKSKFGYLYKFNAD